MPSIHLADQVRRTGSIFELLRRYHRRHTCPARAPCMTHVYNMTPLHDRNSQPFDGMELLRYTSYHPAEAETRSMIVCQQSTHRSINANNNVASYLFAIFFYKYVVVVLLLPISSARHLLDIGIDSHRRRNI